MTADDLMRLVSRYVEACDDLGEGLFEKPLSKTDALHAKATELHGQILAEAYRLQAVESAAMTQSMKHETVCRELAKVNNEFGSENADWPDAWRRVAEVKERAGRLWRDNEALRAALTLAVQAMRAPLDEWKGECERKALDAANAALGPNVRAKRPVEAAGRNGSA